MKKFKYILLTLITVFVFSSCNYEPVTEETTIPIEVLDQIQDTTIQEYNVIIDDKHVYIFDSETKELQYKYNNIDGNNTVGLIFVLTVIFFIAGFCFFFLWT